MYVTGGHPTRGNKEPVELASLVKGNQIIVEHRCFGRSRRDSMDWKCLTTVKAAEDHHHIAPLLKTNNRGKWLSVGIRKRGQTTLFYRYYFPCEVDASVAHFAPVNFSQEDPPN